MLKFNGGKKGNAEESSLISWGPITAIWVTVLAFIGSQVIGAVGVSVYPLIRGWDDAQTDKWLQNSAYGQFLYIAVASVSLLTILWWFLRYKNSRPSQIGLRKPRWIDSLYALGGFAVYFVIFLLILYIVREYIPNIDTRQKQEIGFNTYSYGFELLCIFVGLVVLPPIVEEILFRGFLYTGLRTKMPKIFAALLTSIVFAIVHLQFGSEKPLLWVAAIDTFLLSLVLVYLRDKTGRLWASMGVHMIKNSVAFISLFILHLS